MLALLIVTLAACSKKTDYKNMIPVDATAVVSLNLESLTNKSGLNDRETKLKLIDALKSGLSAASLLQVEKIIKDPSESGISVKDPIYIFTSPAFSSPVVVAKVDNEDKLRTTLGLMASEQMTSAITNVDGYSYSVMPGNSYWMFNESVIIMSTVRGSSQQDLMSRLILQRNDNSIQQNSHFQKMEKNKGDIRFYASMDALPGQMRQMGMGTPGDVNPADIMAVGHINFENGKIEAHIERYSENENVQAMLDRQDKAMGKINNNLLSEFPATTLAYFTVNINGEELYNMLVSNPYFRNNVSLAEATQLRDLFHSLKGDISAGLINISMNTLPTFVAFAETENGNSLSALYNAKNELGLRRGEDIINLAPDEYVYRTRQNNIFFGFKNKKMYATNDELLYQDIARSPERSLKDARYSSNIRGKRQYMVVDIEAITQLPFVKMIIGMGGRQVSSYYDLASRFSYLEVVGEGNNKTQVNVVFRDQNVNSLKQITDFAKRFAGL